MGVDREDGRAGLDSKSAIKAHCASFYAARIYLFLVKRVAPLYPLLEHVY